MATAAAFDKVGSTELTAAQSRSLKDIFDGLKKGNGKLSDENARGMAENAFCKKYVRRKGSFQLKESLTLEEKLEAVQEAGARHTGWETNLARMMGGMLKALFGDVEGLDLDGKALKDLAAKARELLASAEKSDQRVAEVWLDSALEMFGQEPSLRDLENKISKALTEKFGKACSEGFARERELWPQDVYSSYVVFRDEEGQTQSISYTVKDDGSVELGEPKKVAQVWVPVGEDAEVQEVIRKEGDKFILYSKDGSKKLGEFDSKGAAEAREKEIEKMKHIKEAAAQTRDGIKFSASDFAYVPDSDAPSTWKILLAETPGKITVAQLGRAAAAFSPGGFRGQKVQLPAKDVAKVKAKIRAAYHALGVKDDAIPQSVREDAPVEVNEEGLVVVGDPDDSGFEVVEDVQEAVPVDIEVSEETKGVGGVTFDDTSMTIKGTTILRPGTSLNKRHYTQEAIHKGYQMFEGTKMYLDHPPKSKSSAPRSVRELVSKLSRTWVDEESGALRGDVKVFRRDFYDFAKEAAEDVGISINALCKGIPNYPLNGERVDYIQEFVKSHSVDWVADAGAGGGILVQESFSKEELMSVLKELTAEELRQERPDLIEMLVQEVTDEKTKLQKELDENKQQLELKESNERVKTYLAKESKLPIAAQERIAERFSTGIVSEEELKAKLDQAIENEKGYIRSLTPAGVKIVGVGEGAPAGGGLPLNDRLDKVLGISSKSGAPNNGEKGD